MNKIQLITWNAKKNTALDRKLTTMNWYGILSINSLDWFRQLQDVNSMEFQAGFGSYSTGDIGCMELDRKMDGKNQGWHPWQETGWIRFGPRGTRKQHETSHISSLCGTVAPWHDTPQHKNGHSSAPAHYVKTLQIGAMAAIASQPMRTLKIHLRKIVNMTATAFRWHFREISPETARDSYAHSPKKMRHKKRG